MSDDLFWPPLSGDGDDNASRPTEPGSSGTYPTAPLTPPEPDASQPGRSRRVGTASIVAVTAFVFGVGGVAVGAELLNNNGSSTPSSVGSTTLPVSASALTTSPKSYAGIAARVLPSVVSINVTATNGSGDTGSGVILSADGYILTNNHVVAAVASGDSLSVTFNDGTSQSAKVIGTDSLDDLAVIKVAKTGLTPAVLGDSAAIQVGDPVLAVGSPLGLTGTVTAGIVSALNRPVETQAEETNPFSLNGGNSAQAAQPPVFDAIQTDAAINPGNSGGPLVDSKGDVVGINSAIASLGADSIDGSQSGSIGVGFAIPINQAKTIANELINTGHAVHPLLGVELEDVTASNGADRAVVHSVTTGGPAAKAGIKSGDVITAIDGASTQGADAVIAAIRSHQPGQQVSVTVQHGSSSQTVTATLGTEPASQG
jgi:putative serine protease PepD